jgi:hypothetical protein
VKGLAFALLLGATTYSSAGNLLLNTEVIPFSAVAVYAAQILIVLGIVAFARKIPMENSEKMKPQAVVGIDGSGSHRRNGSACVLSMAIITETVMDWKWSDRGKWWTDGKTRKKHQFL